MKNFNLVNLLVASVTAAALITFAPIPGAGPSALRSENGPSDARGPRSGGAGPPRAPVPPLWGAGWPPHHFFGVPEPGLTTRW